MKNTLKHSLLAVAAVIASTPAFAADTTSPRIPTKGTKSYQVSRSQPSTTEEQQATAETANPQDIAPAAGATDDQKADKGFNLRDEMRLPRKN